MMEISHGDQSFYLHFQGMTFLGVMVLIKVKVKKPIRISQCSCHSYCKEGIAHTFPKWQEIMIKGVVKSLGNEDHEWIS